MVGYNTQDINLEGIEDVFRICGWQTGKAALEQRIHEFVEANDKRIQSFLQDMERYDKPRLQGAPCTAKNLPREDIPGLNYFAPMKILQVHLLRNGSTRHLQTRSASREHGESS